MVSASVPLLLGAASSDESLAKRQRRARRGGEGGRLGGLGWRV